MWSIYFCVYIYDKCRPSTNQRRPAVGKKRYGPYKRRSNKSKSRINFSHYGVVMFDYNI